MGWCGGGDGAGGVVTAVPLLVLDLATDEESSVG